MPEPELHGDLARPSDLAAVAAFCAVLAPGAPGVAAWWAERIARDDGRVGLVRRGGEAAGLCVLDSRPIVSLSGRIALRVAAPDAEPQVLGALNALFDRLARAEGASEIYLSQPIPADGPPPAPPPGFETWRRLEVMRLPVDQPDDAPPPGVTVARYAGGDPRADAEAAALAWRMLRREEVWPPFDGAAFGAIVADPASSWRLARETATGRVVAVAETMPALSYFNMLAVDRRWWGAGLADHVARAALREMGALGSPSASSLVRAENAASIKLQTRLGAVHAGAQAMYLRRVAPAAATDAAAG